MIKVEVVYLDSQEYSGQYLVSIDIEENSTILEAIKKSRVLHKFSNIDLTKNKVGIYGKERSLEHILENNDRVEIYKGLKICPKENRRKKAKLNPLESSKGYNKKR